MDSGYPLSGDVEHGTALITHEVKDLSEFIKISEDLSFAGYLNLYRGQPVQGNLLPSAARALPQFDSSSVEKRMLDQFRLMGASMLASSLSQLELMVMAQHYGLRTRLLDWSQNPLIALYFACAERSAKEQDVYVYSLCADDLVATDIYSRDPFSVKRTQVFQPPLNNPRIVAQQGWFTLHCYSDKSRRYVGLEKNSNLKNLLTEIVVPGKYKQGILDSLNRHGISSHTVFPDLGGLAEHLNRTIGYALSDVRVLGIPEHQIPAEARTPTEPVSGVTSHSE